MRPGLTASAVSDLITVLKRVRTPGHERNYCFMVRSPASNKKRRQGVPPATRGRTRRKRWGYQRHHPLQAVSGAVGAVYELPKKRGVPPPLSSTHRPLTEGNESKMTEEIPTSRRHYDQTTTGVSNPRKSRGPTLCSVRRIHPFTDDAFLCSPRYIPAAISRNAHK